VATEVQERIVAQIWVAVNGTALAQELLDDLSRAIIDSSVYLPDMAVLEFGNKALRWSEEKRFQVGQEVRIELGERDLKREVFIGEITCVELDINISGRTPLIIRAYDRSHRLHRGRFTRSFTNMKDSDIARTIANDLALGADVRETTEVHEYLLQNNQTNWEFLQERAMRLGFELLVCDETLVFKPPPSAPAEPIDLAWNEELLSFRAKMTASEQVSEVEVRGWDPLRKKEVVGRASQPQHTPEIGERRTGGKVAADAFHHDARVVVAREPVYSPVQADGLAQTVLNDLGGTFVTAEGMAMGDPRLRLGSEVNLKHVGEQFSGRYVVTEIRHAYEPEGYRIEFKSTGRRSTDVLSILSQPAPMRTHVLTGVVTNNKDPRDAGRVKVKIPLLGPDIESHWCRVIAPGAGPQRGLEYLPEVDDEVLVVGHDINNLYVLGGLWNLEDAPPQKNSEAVSGGRVAKRIIRSRTGHVIMLDDSDGGGSITIVDSTEKNKIMIDTAKNSLEMAVDGDVKLRAGRNLEIEAAANVTIKANANFEVEATGGAKLETKAGPLDLKGSTGATLQSNTKTDIKAPMVNIGQ